MVIISTRAIEVSIQALSPEFGVHFSSTGGLAVPSHAGGAASAAGAAAAGAAGAGACANEPFTNAKLRNAARRNPQARANSPARDVLLGVMVLAPVRKCSGAGSQRRLVGLARADAH